MILKTSFLALVGLVIAGASFSQGKYDKHLVEVEIEETKELLTFVKTPDLFSERWDTLAQPNFWKFVMQMSPGTSILNVRASRKILEITSLSEWNKKSDDEKEEHRALLRKENGLPADERIFMTTGKNDFYQFDKVFPSISKGVNLFIDNDTDPWYAQAILMIESPGKLAYSSVGALGPFQIMKSVARNHGLRVDKYVDERKDFAKSAKASSHLIRTACIPEAKRILRKFGIEVEGETQYELWFRLIVLHCYQFGNSSQNYSQLALASLLILDNLIFEKCSSVDNCSYEK
jgi:hypothetical protein